MSGNSKHPQEVRFYGRRQGRGLRPGRRALLNSLLPKVQLSLPAGGHGKLNPDTLFGGPKSAYWIEIGFGSGEHLAALAEQYPDVGFIGCEPFVNGVAALIASINDRSLDNIRIYNDDVHHLFPCLPDNSFERIYVPYADPWPKQRHHRRRLVRGENIDVFARLLIDGGQFRFASDHMGYVQWVLGTMQRKSAFQWTARRPGDWRIRPVDSIETRYEAKARRKGSACVYLCFERLPRS